MLRPFDSKKRGAPYSLQALEKSVSAIIIKKLRMFRISAILLA
jgi:hypothetical protein